MAADGFDAKVVETFKARFADVTDTSGSEKVRVFASFASVNIIAVKAERSNFNAVKAFKR